MTSKSIIVTQHKQKKNRKNAYHITKKCVLYLHSSSLIKLLGPWVIWRFRPVIYNEFGLITPGTLAIGYHMLAFKPVLDVWWLAASGGHLYYPRPKI